MPFKLPDLPYAASALEPHMSARTLELHHGKHHKAYVDKTNKLAQEQGHSGKGLVELIRAAKGPLFNNAAQIWNHSFFWQCLAPGGGGKPTAALANRIDKDLGGSDAFIAEFSKQAEEHFGSGWAWLVEAGGKLQVKTYHDADTPVAHEGVRPLLTLDVWEHAYYVDHANARPKFIKTVMEHLVNWEFAAVNLDGKGADRADQKG